MTADEIRTEIRRLIREPRPKTVSDTVIDSTVLRGTILLGSEIKIVEPAFFNKRVSLSSNTHVFSWPSDCSSILTVRDLKTTAKTITDVTNASPIVISSAAHGFSDDDIIVVHDVAGNTAANGTWKVANKTTDTLELYGSTGDGAYISGGKMFQESNSFTWIRETEPSEINLNDNTIWYPRERNIVVGDYDFANDILVEYVSIPDAITDIPEEYHMGLVAYGVINLLIIPSSKAKDFEDKKISKEFYMGIWGIILQQIKVGATAAIDPLPISFNPGED